MAKNIQNPGSALGEAIGAQIELALNDFLKQLTDRLGYHFISKGLGSTAVRQKKLLLFDKFGTAYNIDSVIANDAMQPIILVECKYIRYKKHNRDKGSWICTAHPALRRKYTSIRSSIAVLAGNWSKTSLAMMKSYRINIFLIPFNRLCSLLSQHSIDFDWGEKDRAKALDSWNKFSRLSKSQRAALGKSMIDIIRTHLEDTIIKVLDDSISREVDSILIELYSNLGEVSTHEFKTVEDATAFLNSQGLDAHFLSTDSPSLPDQVLKAPDDN